MRFERRFTKDGQAAYANIEFQRATSEIRNPDGTIVFRAENIEVPAQFSQVATDILAQKYFRKAGVPEKLKKIKSLKQLSDNDIASKGGTTRDAVNRLKNGSGGLNLKSFIRVLRGAGLLGEFERVFETKDDYSPKSDFKKTQKTITWGEDE